MNMHSQINFNIRLKHYLTKNIEKIDVRKEIF